MKNLEEIDCNEILWEVVVAQSNNGWGNLENECRFAFRTRDEDILSDDIDEVFHRKYPSADQIEISEVVIDFSDLDDYEEDDKYYRYFVASVVIYESGI